MSFFLPLHSADPLAPRRYGYSLFASVAVHSLLLAIAFVVIPPITRWKLPSIDVVLVNAKSLKAPEHAQTLAQANLEGGGDKNENVRAKTFLPPMEKEKAGNDLLTTRTKALNRQSLTNIQKLTSHQSKLTVPSQVAQPVSSPAVIPTPTLGEDDRQRDLAIAQLRAEIERNIQQYNQRPRRTFVGASSKEYGFAEYVEAWRQKVEKIGNLNYPPEARGKLYGSLILTVAIRKDGSIEQVTVSKSSPYPVLDKAAEAIVRMSAPFQSLPENSNTDILEITRTWTFTSDDQLQSH